MPRRKNSAATATFSISHSPATARAQMNPQGVSRSSRLLQGAGAGSTKCPATCSATYSATYSATRTTPPLTNLWYCSSVQWAAPGACRSSARIAGTSFDVAARMETGIGRCFVSGYRLFVSGYRFSDTVKPSYNMPLQGLRNERLLNLLPRRLRENLSVGMAEVIRFQFFGTNRIAPLEMLPTQPGNQAAVGILNLLDLNSGCPNRTSQSGIRRDDRLPFGFGKKLFPAQQTFAVHLNVHANAWPEFVVANIHIAASRIERRENPAMRRAFQHAAAPNRFQQ